ncbi:CYTH domain-containing protein, partial [Candidatus Micrarchaeota archaeon]|nr:CYTH domain-containing protein [Candidatus Micrarchaeota archaeon]
MEVEVKAKLAGPAGLNAVKQKLVGLKACLVEELAQHDAYYYREPERKTRGPGDFIVRIRKQGNENYLTY